MSDRIETMGGSLIQHGPDNNRIYLMKLDPSDLPGLPARLDALAQEQCYTKIFAKVPAPYAALFIDAGYQREGTIPRFYDGITDAGFLGKFLDPARARTVDREQIDRMIALAQSKRVQTNQPLTTGYTLRQAMEGDAVELAALYRRVFDSYPFPIGDPNYLVTTMRSHVCYFIAEANGQIVAASSGEMDRSHHNAEMTDFATHPEHRGHRLAVHLLNVMEQDMRRRGIRTLYTIARSLSPGINIAFARCGYTFGGTLINNTQISGSIESMNLWYKG